MEEPFRHSVAEVSLAAVERNYRAMRKCLREGTRVCTVVKADAYGHGAAPVAKRLVAAGAEVLGVATLEEGIELRRAAIDAPILVMQGIRPVQVPQLVEFALTPVVFDKDVLKALAAYGAKVGKTLPFHLKVDTGMTRLGIALDEVGAYLDFIARTEHIALEGFASHFACAEVVESPLNALQKKNFAKAVAMVQERGLKPLFHLANSAAAVLDPETHYDMVRIGISLYGAHPGASTIGKVVLEPALVWKSRVQQIKEVPPDTPVSYGATYRTERAARIGVLPVGYADGYRRLLSNNAEVLVRGRRCPVVGTVCMDLTMIDLTDVQEARVEDEVVLIGRQEGEEVSAADLARRLETIPYEVLCGISKRVARVYA